MIKRNIQFNMLITVIATGIYWPILMANKVVNRDNFVLEQAKKITGILDYINRVMDGRIADLQPVRDLFFKIEYLVSNFMNTDIYIWGNVFLWVIICIKLRKILERVGSSTLTSDTLTLLFLVHPIFVQTVAWVVAAKHLVALLFIMYSFESVLNVISREKYKTISWLKPLVFYILSLCSHPISILFPVWVFTHLKENKIVKKNIKVVLVFSLIMIFFGCANYYYYDVIYPQNYFASKLLKKSLFSDRVLALGRYTIQIVYPSTYAAVYFKGSLLNLIGLPVGVLLLFGAIKSSKTPLAKSSLVLMFVPLLPVLMKMTNIFVSDTYLLITMFAICLYLSQSDLFFHFTTKKWGRLILCFLILTLGMRTIIESSFFTNYGQYVENSYRKEKSCANLQYYTQDLFNRGKVIKATELGEKMIARRCVWVGGKNSEGFKILLAKILTFSPRGVYEKKRSQMEILSRQALYFKYAYAVFLLKNNKYREGEEILGRTIDDSAGVDINFDDIFMREIESYCEKMIKNKSLCDRYEKLKR